MRITHPKNVLLVRYHILNHIPIKQEPSWNFTLLMVYIHTNVIYIYLSLSICVMLEIYTYLKIYTYTYIYIYCIYIYTYISNILQWQKLISHELPVSSARRPWGIFHGPALHREAQLGCHLAQQAAEAAVGQVLRWVQRHWENGINHKNGARMVKLVSPITWVNGRYIYICIYISIYSQWC